MPRVLRTHVSFLLLFFAPDKIVVTLFIFGVNIYTNALLQVVKSYKIVLCFTRDHKFCFNSCTYQIKSLNHFRSFRRRFPCPQIHLHFAASTHCIVECFLWIKTWTPFWEQKCMKYQIFWNEVFSVIICKISAWLLNII